jgi:hypothetical protein
MRAATSDEASIDPLFHRDGDWLVATEMTQGPWNPQHQHGGAVAAALVWALERRPTPVPMRATRIVFDLMHPVPIGPLRPEVQVVRAGRRVQLIDCTLHDESERALARASALMIRVDPKLELGDQARRPPEKPLGFRPGDPEVGKPALPQRSGFAYASGFLRALDFQREVGAAQTGMPGRAWTRLRGSVVGGDEVSPAMRLAVAGDFTSALAVGLDFSRFVAINPDVTLYIERLPESDWIGVESLSSISPDGIGTSSGTLHDLRGRVARTHTSLYIGTRQPRGDVS